MRFLEPVIKLPQPDIPMLSFMNLVEAHVLGGIRRLENVPFVKVRLGLTYLEERAPSPHPLADWLFETDGANLFVRAALGELRKAARGSDRQQTRTLGNEGYNVSL